jgi:hypothetical protein
VPPHRPQRHDLIDNPGQFLHSTSTCDGRRDRYSPGRARTDAVCRRTRGGAGRNTIVDKDNAATSDVDCATAPAVSINSSPQFEPRRRDCSRVLLLRDVLALAHRLCAHHHVALGEGTHGELRLGRDADFSHHQDVERHREHSRDFEGNDDSATGQTQHDVNIVLSRAEAKPELTSAVGSIVESLHMRGLAPGCGGVTARG